MITGFVLSQVIVFLAGSTGWLLFKEKIKKRLTQQKIEALIAQQEEQQAQQILKITSFLKEQLHWKSEDSEMKAKELLQAQRELLKAMIYLYWSQDLRGLEDVPQKINTAVAAFTSLKTVIVEDIPLPADQIMIEPALVENQVLLNNTNQIANKLLHLLAKASGQVLTSDDPNKIYDLHELQEQLVRFSGEARVVAMPIPEVELTQAEPVPIAVAPVTLEVIPEPIVVAAAEIPTEPPTPAPEPSSKEIPAFDFRQFAVADLDLDTDLSLKDIAAAQAALTAVPTPDPVIPVELQPPAEANVPVTTEVVKENSF